MSDDDCDMYSTCILIMNITIIVIITIIIIVIIIITIKVICREHIFNDHTTLDWTPSHYHLIMIRLLHFYPFTLLLLLINEIKHTAFPITILFNKLMITFNRDIRIRVIGQVYTRLLCTGRWKSLVFFSIEELAPTLRTR